MKIKKLIVTTAFILIISTSTPISLCDLNSYQITKTIIDDNEKNTKPNVPIIAHRGFSSLEIENTAKAINLGFESNCTTAVEIDVQLTKDNQIVLFHDSKLNNKNISEYTLEELKQIPITEKTLDNFDDYLETLFDCKSGNLTRERMNTLNTKEEKIATLDEILELHNYYPNKELVIELKINDNTKDLLIDTIYEKIKKHNNPNIIIQSSNYEALLNMKNKYPNLTYHLIINQNNYQYLNNLEFDGYGIRKNLINYDDINKLLKNKKKVAIWTINSYTEYEETLSKLDDLKEKVSYITNYPDALKTWHNIITKNNNKTKIKK